MSKKPKWMPEEHKTRTFLWTDEDAAALGLQIGKGQLIDIADSGRRFTMGHFYGICGGIFYTGRANPVKLTEKNELVYTGCSGKEHRGKVITRKPDLPECTRCMSQGCAMLHTTLQKRILDDSDETVK